MDRKEVDKKCGLNLCGIEQEELACHVERDSEHSGIKNVKSFLNK